MTTLEETGIQIRTAVIELQKLANTTRITDPETASKIDGIANNITEIVDGKNTIMKNQEINHTPIYEGHHDAVIIAFREKDGTNPAEIISQTPFIRELKDQEEFEQDVMAAFNGLEKAYSHWPGEYVGLQLILQRDYVNMT